MGRPRCRRATREGEARHRVDLERVALEVGLPMARKRVSGVQAVDMVETPSRTRRRMEYIHCQHRIGIYL